VENKMAGMTKEELITVIKANSQLSDEKLAELADKIKGSMMEEFSEKLEELGKKEDNKLKQVEPVDDKKDENKWDSFGEQLQAIVKASMPMGEIDKRLVASKAILGSNELVGAEGAFLIAPEYTNEILKIAHDEAIVAKDCRHLKIKGNRIILNAINETSRATGARWGGIQVYWVAEGGTVTAKKPAFRQVDLKLNKLMGLCYATEELLADQSALQGITTQGFGEEFAFVIDDAVIRGTGAGQPLGVLNCNAIQSKTIEADQDADTVVAENIDGMYNLMPAKNRIKAKWYIIQDVEPQLNKMGYKMGTAAIPVFTSPAVIGGGGIVGSPNGRLKNRDIQVIEQCSALGDVGDILFLDLSQYLIIEKAGGLKSAASIHVAFLSDQQCFRFTYRLDGQPLWHAGITSYKGSVTRSPFVSLAAR
jgi:HK97 family phage major capsid protein